MTSEKYSGRRNKLRSQEVEAQARLPPVETIAAQLGYRPACASHMVGEQSYQTMRDVLAQRREFSDLRGSKAF